MSSSPDSPNVAGGAVPPKRKVPVPGDPDFNPYYRRCLLRHQTYKDKDDRERHYLHCDECKVNYRNECPYISARKNKVLVTNNGPDFRKKCSEVVGLRCGVEQHMCVDCQGESYAFPCDSAKAIIGPETPDCQVCVHLESDLDACVYGSRARACMTTPCGFERVKWE